MKKINEMNITFKALSINEGFARSCVAAFCVQGNPSLDVLTDIKTAVSEAVTNVVVHAYPNNIGNVHINVTLFDIGVEIEICDDGIGIKNIEQAKEPFYTTKPEQERSGMGFTVMESFMDRVEIFNNKGLVVRMFKNFNANRKTAIGE